jgi:signal transduction histidine kinase
MPRPVRTGRRRHDTRDLAAFNRWLSTSRVNAAAGVVVVVTLAYVLGVEEVRVLPGLGIAAVLALFSAVWVRAGRWWGEDSLGYFVGQTAFDLVVCTIGIGAVTQGLAALLARSLFILIIVPAGLISVPIGLGVATAAVLGHGALLVFETGTFTSLLSAAFLIPTGAFYLVAQQALFYGAHLEQKNATLSALAERLDTHRNELAVEARTSAALAEVARTLSSTLEAPALLARVNRTMLEYLGADWAATCLVESEHATFRLVAVSDAEVPLAELERLSFPLDGWPAVARLESADHVRLDGGDAPLVPAPLSAGKPLETVLLAGLRLDGALAGFLAVGYGAGRGGVPAWATQLHRGIAEHAAIVLRNARLLDEVRQASQLKSEFVGAISHELRSPLNVILGYLEMLIDGAFGSVPAEQAHALERAQAQALTLLEMITALLDMNRLEAGRLPLETSPVAVDDLLHELHDQLPETWGHPGVALHVLAGDTLPVLHTDRGKLKTVLRNLVHNALKFTTAGHVIVTAEARGTDVAFMVADTGCGIPPDALPHVFEMFRQVAGAGGGGVGLGLHIVHRFVAALGGRVDVTSDLGQGTCFTVTLPVAREASRADAA